MDVLILFIKNKHKRIRFNHLTSLKWHDSTFFIKYYDINLSVDSQVINMKHTFKVDGHFYG